MEEGNLSVQIVYERSVKYTCGKWELVFTLEGIGGLQDRVLYKFVWMECMRE